jgi:hypothetical protein
MAELPRLPSLTDQWFQAGHNDIHDKVKGGAGIAQSLQRLVKRVGRVPDTGEILLFSKSSRPVRGTT